MGNFLKKNKKKLKYSSITNEDLEQLKNKGLQLKEELKDINLKKEPKRYKENFIELNKILVELERYKKYVSKTSK